MDTPISFTDAMIGTRASDTERIKTLRSTMAEARQVANAAEEDYRFAQQAFARKYELFTWAVLKHYTIEGKDGRWRVQEQSSTRWDATIAEALLRAWRAERAHKPKVTIMDISCLECPYFCR